VTNINCSLSFERPTTSEHFVQQNTRRENICSRVDAITSRLFRCCVSGSAVWDANLGQLGVVNTGSTRSFLIEQLLVS